MSTKVVPTAASATAQSLPSATLSLTDSHTWVLIFGAVASIVASVFHKDLSAYIPLASILVTGFYGAYLATAKHSYAAALATVASTATQAAAVAPANISAEIAQAAAIMQAVKAIQTTVTGATTPAPVATSVPTNPINLTTT